jgi:hypothetical protein
MKLCKTKRCRNPKPHWRRFCRKCQWRQLKERDPLRYSFYHLKNRAKQRGHEFSLTFDQYKDFALKTGYFERKGKTAESLSINRIDNSRGYHADNIEAVTLSYNSRLKYAPIPQWLKDEILGKSKAASAGGNGKRGSGGRMLIFQYDTTPPPTGSD